MIAQHFVFLFLLLLLLAGAFNKTLIFIISNFPRALHNFFLTRNCQVPHETLHSACFLH